MEQNILSQLKWFDIFLIILFLRICYIAMNTGISVEAFKLCGTICSVYLSFHYYNQLADFISKRLALESFPLDFLNLLTFVLLATFGYLIFFGLRLAFMRLVKMETISFLNHWGGLILGVFRGILLLSIFAYAAFISTLPYLSDSVKSAALGKNVISIAPNTYRAMWDVVFSKFSVTERSNPNISENENKFLK